MRVRPDLLDELGEALQSRGLRHRVAGAQMVGETAWALRQLRDRRIVPAVILSEYADGLFPAPAEGTPEIRSLVVVASPSPAARAAFRVGGRTVEAVIPPTYISTRTRNSTLDLLLGVLRPAGFSSWAIALPVKMLAVRTGLAQYGRNGIAYVEGLGSFARLDVYATDAPLVVADEIGTRAFSDRLSVPPRLRTCTACSWCHHSCPTGCIDRSGDRINPLRCLAYLNEHEGDWPSWLEPSSHNSLIGCMVCQQGCRHNQEGGYITVEGSLTTFDEGESAVVLEDRPEGELPGGLRARLKSLDMAAYSTVLGRNLRALADRA